MDNPALIVIDVQKGIDQAAHWGGNRNNVQAEENISLLLKLWRRQRLPRVIVQHCSTSPRSPFYPGQPGNDLKDIVRPEADEVLVQKSTANAFVGTSLQKELTTNKATSVVITGFVTNNSVEATARMAGDLGIETIVVADACACFDKTGIDGTKYSSSLVHALSLANLKDEYAAIMNTREIIDKYIPAS